MRKELNSHWEWMTSGAQSISSRSIRLMRLTRTRAPGYTRLALTEPM